MSARLLHWLPTLVGQLPRTIPFELLRQACLLLTRVVIDFVARALPN